MKPPNFAERVLVKLAPALTVQATLNGLGLLEPALICSDFANALSPCVSVPAVIYHGRRETVIPLEAVRSLVDDHRLLATVQAIDCPTLVGDG